MIFYQHILELWQKKEDMKSSVKIKTMKITAYKKENDLIG